MVIEPKVKNFSNQDSFCRLAFNYMDSFGKKISDYNLETRESEFILLKQQFDLAQQGLDYSKLTLDIEGTDTIELIKLNYNSITFSKLQKDYNKLIEFQKNIHQSLSQMEVSEYVKHLNIRQIFSEKFAIYFLPSIVEFIKENKKIIEENLYREVSDAPKLVDLSIYYILANSTYDVPLHVDTISFSSSEGITELEVNNDNIGSSKFNSFKNIHFSLTKTSESSVFSMISNSSLPIFNILYVVKYAHDIYNDSALTSNLLKAKFISEYKGVFPPAIKLAANFYSHNFFIYNKFCANQQNNSEHRAIYYDLDPGEAIVFTPNFVHAGKSLNPVEIDQDRYSIVLRSANVYHSTYYTGLYKSMFPVIECAYKYLWEYEDMAVFYDQKNCAYDIERAEISLSEDSCYKTLKGLEEHFKKAQSFFDNDILELNQDFLKCLGNIENTDFIHDEL